MPSLNGFNCTIFNTDTTKRLSDNARPESSIARMQEIEVDEAANTLTAFAEVSPGRLGIEVEGSKADCEHALM